MVIVLWHDDVIKWKHISRYWPFVGGFHRSPVTSPHQGQQRETLMFSFICAWINGWVNNRNADDLSRHRGHSDVTVMMSVSAIKCKHTISFLETFPLMKVSKTIGKLVIRRYSFSFNSHSSIQYVPRLMHVFRASSCFVVVWHQGQISRSLETTRLGIIMIVSLWNLTVNSAALLPRCPSNFKAIINV